MIPTQNPSARSPRGLAAAAAVAVAWPAVLGAQERPLRIEDPDPLPAGTVVVEVGADFEKGRTFPLSGLAGDLVRVPYLGISVSLGGVAEFQVDSGFDVLYVDDRDSDAPLADVLDFTGDASTDIEDPVVATKIRLQRQTRLWPAVALRVATKLPAASNESGLGKDATDWFLSLLAAKDFGRTRLVGNFGLAVLAIPLQGDRQNDLLTAGAALVHRASPRLDLVAEVVGRFDAKGEPLPGTEDLGQARLGLRWRAARLRLDAGLLAGLTRYDPDWGATLGLTYAFQPDPEWP